MFSVLVDVLEGESVIAMALATANLGSQVWHVKKWSPLAKISIFAPPTESV